MSKAATWLAALAVAAFPQSAIGQMASLAPFDERTAFDFVEAEPLSFSELADEESSDVASCGGVNKVATDLFKRFKAAVDDENNCSMGYTGAGGMVARGDCAYGGPKFSTQYAYMIALFNALTPAWATIGPRQWKVLSAGHAVSHTGTIRAKGARLYVTPYPNWSDKVRVSVRKVDGQNPVGVAVCGTTRTGVVKKFWDFEIRNSDPADKLYSKDITGTHGLILSTHFVGRNLLFKTQYRVRGTLP